MALNEILRDADHLGSFPVPAGTLTGVPVIAGALVGITQTKAGEGGNPPNTATVWRKGAHLVPVTGATTYGLPIYIPPAGGALTATATGNTLWGHALEAKSAGTASIRVAIARV